jgi:beta-glucanase (GH16 family)
MFPGPDGYTVQNPIMPVVVLFAALMAGIAHAGYPVYADGDLAPLGAPDGQINTGDYLVASRIVLDQITPTELEYAHGDLYPPGEPDGLINVQDLLLLQQQLLSPTANSFVENLELFVDGPSTVQVEVGDTTSSTTLVPDGYIGPGASVVNDPYFTDPDDAANTVWRFSVEGGVANVYLGTADLGSDPVLDSGFDLSGDGGGWLVFDIKVISLSAGATLTVKIDSGYPNLGQVALTPSQYTIGSWRRVAIDFADLLADPGPGAGLDLGNVVNAFVIEVTGGDAEFYLDNIFITRTCPAVEGCNATVKTKATYSLVWSDEFNGTELDTENWSAETGYGSNGWGNDEWQLYTGSSDNVAVSGGNLVISARCASPPACGKRNGTITSARINTLNKFSFKYGKVEARIRPPVGKGAWPAFWMLGANFPAVGWPFSGELDVMEVHNRYSNEYTTHFTLHWCDERLQDPGEPGVCYPDFRGWTFVTDQLSLFPDSLGDDFHIYSAEWDANGVVGKIDGIPYYSLPINPATMEEFLEEFFMILNVAIGGTLGGDPDAGTPWPQTMLVDYVRVYQADGGEGTFTIGAPVSETLGVYSETHTYPVLPYSAIVNGADFGGNVLNIDQYSTNAVPFDGSVSLEVIYNNTGSSYGGFLFNFTLGRDISAYQTLKFSLDAAAMSQMGNMTIELENPGQQKFAAQLSNYTPTVNGNWATYEIPLADFGGVDLTNVLYLGFWNPRTTSGQLTFGTLYFDDIHFAGGGG